MELSLEFGGSDCATTSIIGMMLQELPLGVVDWQPLP